MWRRSWHSILCFFGVRNPFDWAPPGLGPEVNHPYMAHQTIQCCEHCGGGRHHAIHKPPYDPRRLAEILGNPPAVIVQGSHGPMYYRGENAMKRFERPGPGAVHTGSHPLTEYTCDDSACWCGGAGFPTHARRRGYLEQ